MNDVVVDIQSKANSISPIQDIGLFVSRIAGVGLIVASLVSFGFLIWGGLQWILAGDDKSKVEQARSRLTNAIVGLAVVAVVWALFMFINYFLGLGVVRGAGGGGGGGGDNSPIAGCSCYNGGCVSAGTIGPITPGGTCYTCQPSGSWGGSPITGPSCPYSITCGSCI